MLVVYPSLIKPPQGSCYCESSKLLIIQCSHRFLAVFLFCTQGSHRGTVLESPKAFLTHLNSHSKSLIRVCHYAVMLQRSCCSTLPRVQHLISHITLSFYCFPELGVVCCYGHGLVNNCDIHLNGIR